MEKKKRKKKKRQEKKSDGLWRVHCGFAATKSKARPLMAVKLLVP